MRISDWSSDVCSSDLVEAEAVQDEDVAPLRLDDAGKVEGAGPQDDGNKDEADRDLVGYHLSGRPHRRGARIFGVGRQTGDDHALNAERGGGEVEEQADIDVGEQR